MSNIPIILLNRNRLTTTKKLVDQLTDIGYKNIYILDIDSTYLPLLEYYENCPAKIIYTTENIGHKGFWEKGYIKMFKNNSWIVISDSDIELNKNTQKGFIEQMVNIAKDYRVDKAGLAIEYLDIPEEKMRNAVWPTEERYWKNRLPHSTHEVYNAIIDTTFQVIKPTCPYGWHYPAVRIAGDGYICKHIPWYTQIPLSEEDKFILEHSDGNISSYKKAILSLCED